MKEENVPDGKIEDPAQLGSLLRRVRKQQGLTQEDLAAVAGVGPRLIGEIERGKVTAEIGKVFQLLHYLGLDLVVRPRSTRNWKG